LKKSEPKLREEQEATEPMVAGAAGVKAEIGIGIPRKKNS
jgi:hypothetical protein